MPMWRREAHDRFQWYLHGSITTPDDFRYTAEGLLRSVRNAEACGVELDPETNTRYVAALVRLMPKRVRPRAAGADELLYLESVQSDDHDEAGVALRLRLEQASFYARQNQGADRRGAELEAARRLRLPNHTRVEVLVVCAQYRVDIGEYRTAGELLAECDRILRTDPDCDRLLPDIVVCYGVLHFARGHLWKARRCFERTLALMAERHREDSERPTVKAHHYLGKIDALFGRYDRAIVSLVHAERVLMRRRTEDPRRSAYNHSRLGGVLRRAGSPAHEALWHLELAQQLFRMAGDRGSGQGLHAASVATPSRHAKANELAVRATLYGGMVERARANSHGRGVVIGAVQLTWIAVRRLDWRQAVRGALTTLAAGCRLALASGILPAATGVLQLLTALAIRKVRDGRAALLRRPPVHCLCGAPHAPDQ
jgi:hypothetical protein